MKISVVPEKKVGSESRQSIVYWCIPIRCRESFRSSPYSKDCLDKSLRQIHGKQVVEAAVLRFDKLGCSLSRESIGSPQENAQLAVFVGSEAHSLTKTNEAIRDGCTNQTQRLVTLDIFGMSAINFPPFPAYSPVRETRSSASKRVKRDWRQSYALSNGLLGLNIYIFSCSNFYPQRLLRTRCLRRFFP